VVPGQPTEERELDLGELLEQQRILGLLPEGAVIVLREPMAHADDLLLDRRHPGVLQGSQQRRTTIGGATGGPALSFRPALRRHLERLAFLH